MDETELVDGSSFAFDDGSTFQRGTVLTVG